MVVFHSEEFDLYHHITSWYNRKGGAARNKQIRTGPSNVQGTKPLSEVEDMDIDSGG